MKELKESLATVLIYLVYVFNLLVDSLWLGLDPPPLRGAD